MTFKVRFADEDDEDFWDCDDADDIDSAVREFIEIASTADEGPVQRCIVKDPAGKYWRVVATTEYEPVTYTGVPEAVSAPLDVN